MIIKKFYKYCLLFLLTFLTALPSFAMEIAITVDDLPAAGSLPAGISRLDIANQMLTTFKKHHITGVYGMVNGNKVTNDKDGFLVLQKWLQAGHHLGNHTFSHLDLAKVEDKSYIHDIQKNDDLLSQLAPSNKYKFFRYPYLAEGNTIDKRDAIRNYLFAHHYQIAPVTVDFFEYEWIDPYIRCLKMNDTQSIPWLKKSFIEQSLNALIIAHELSQRLFHREIKNILLIHIGYFDAVMLDELLTAYEKQGIKFISLQEALTDPIYQINPNIVRDRSYTLLNQIRLARKIENPDNVKKLYASLPEEKLNSLCR